VGRPRGALLLGADYRALGVARSLGRRGIPVWVLKERAEPLATFSRFARRSLPWPDGGERGRVAFLCELVRAHHLEGWVLIPTADGTVAMVARCHEQLDKHYTLTTPNWQVVRWAYDKRLTYALAQRLEVPSPRTVRADAALNGSGAAVEFPAVLKPAIKEERNALTAAKAWLIEDRTELERRYGEACSLLDPELLMVQELVPGGGEAQFSYAALCRDGVPVASVTARRTRQYPADFGRASTYVETVVCEEMVEPSLHLLRELGYTGLIELEYKRDCRDGVLKLLDMNPRVWGWHTLCVRAGVDFPWLLWLLVSGGRIPPTRAKPGVGWLRLSTDTPTAVREMVSRRLPMREYTRSLRQPRESAIFAWDDPLPGLAEFPVLAYVLARRLLRGEAM
jgi:D-aspartate ligase